MARVEPGVPASVDARLLLDAVLNRIDVAVCLYDPQDRVVLWNEAYLRFFPEEAGILRHGLPYAETLRRYFEENLTAAEAETFPLHLAAGLERHRRLDGPYIYQRRDGRWYEVQPHRLPDGHLLKIWTDVTANQAEQAARDGITEVVAGTIGFARYDQQGRFVLANKAMATMFPRLIDLFRPGATYADHLLRIAGTSLHEAERPRIEGLAARPDPCGAQADRRRISSRVEPCWATVSPFASRVMSSCMNARSGFEVGERAATRTRPSIRSPAQSGALKSQFQPSDAIAATRTSARFLSPSSSDRPSRPCATRAGKPRSRAKRSSMCRSKKSPESPAKATMCASVSVIAPVTQ